MTVMRIKKITVWWLLAGVVVLGLGFFGLVRKEKGISSEAVGVEVPIIMYHSIYGTARYDERYVITPEELERDFEYLKGVGYTAVMMSDLIAYTEMGASLPDKPIVLSFDDGFYNNYTYLYPLLEKYDFKAVISVVGAYTDRESEKSDENPAYSYLSWDNCREMLSSGRVEIQNHSYNFHSISTDRRGSGKKSGEGEEEYKKCFCEDLEMLQKKIKSELDIVATTYTYPYGLVTGKSCEYVKELGFSASLSCEEGMNFLTGDSEELYCMKRYLRSNDRGVESILTEARK